MLAPSKSAIFLPFLVYLDMCQKLASTGISSTSSSRLLLIRHQGRCLLQWHLPWVHDPLRQLQNNILLHHHLLGSHQVLLHQRLLIHLLRNRQRSKSYHRRSMHQLMSHRRKRSSLRRKLRRLQRNCGTNLTKNARSRVWPRLKSTRKSQRRGNQ